MQCVAKVALDPKTFMESVSKNNRIWFNILVDYRKKKTYFCPLDFILKVVVV